MEETTLQVTDEIPSATPDTEISAPSTEPETMPSDETDGGIDYAAMLDADIAELKAAFPELEDLEDIYGLSNPVRFGALRDLGLTPKEAYLASGGKRAVYDNRRHLTASVPRTARGAIDNMPRRELDMARELFGDMSDSDIQKLYRKVKG